MKKTLTIPPRNEYPRPQFKRREWVNLNGEWTCELDLSRSGDWRNLKDKKGFRRKIIVPFCPESKLYGLYFYADRTPKFDMKAVRKCFSAKPGWSRF